MLKVIAIVGSARKKHTYQAARSFLEKLSAWGEVQYEILRLSDYELKPCVGCIQCFEKGEDACPLKDDRDNIFQKMIEADGVVMATPNYSFHVSGLMKIFLDRLGFFFHRPRFFGKAFTAIVAQGIYGGNKILKYFKFIGKHLGFNTIKGTVVSTRETVTLKVEKQNDLRLEKLARRFYNVLKKKALPRPSLTDLMMFRFSRSLIKKELNEDYMDYRYFDTQGWLKSDFFYPVKLGLFKRMMGHLFDRMGGQ